MSFIFTVLHFGILQSLVKSLVLVDTNIYSFTCNSNTYVCTIYTRLGTGDYALTHVAYVTTYLVTWPVIPLTAAKLKLLIISVVLGRFRCREHLHLYDFEWPLLVVSTVSLSNLKYTALGKPYATRGPVCILEIYQWCGDHCFTSSAISEGGYLQQIPRRDKRKS
jgi:hypothetical protein